MSQLEAINLSNPDFEPSEEQLNVLMEDALKAAVSRRKLASSWQSRRAAGTRAWLPEPCLPLALPEHRTEEASGGRSTDF